MAAYPTLLILRLEGALQSWGENSKWDARDTAALPTKSGIVGLLACALGWARGDARIAALFDQIQVAVRADRPGVRMTDYQTVTGHPLRNAEGAEHRKYNRDKQTVFTGCQLPGRAASGGTDGQDAGAGVALSCVVRVFGTEKLCSVAACARSCYKSIC